jgi:ferredoxin
MRPHYEAVLREIPYAAETDDLADLYPLLADADPLPVLSERSRRVLEAYERHRKEILAKGITVGKARLAFHAANCVRCNLCMTGCPYRLIYSAAQTLDALEKSGVLSRHSGLIALKVSEQENSASVIARELHSGRRRELEVDRIFVACGALGTVRLVAESLNLYNRDLHVFESQQFVMPAFSMRAVADPRYAEDFTLNQFNMSISTNRDPSDAAQLHFYTFNRAFIDALPAPLRTRRMENLRTHVLRRLCVALGYLPSWRSPSLIARVQPGRDELSLPKMHITAGPAPRGHNEMVRALVLRLLRAAPLLDLYPIVPMMRVAPGGKSYHWGGTFPHSASPEMLTASDRLGRVGSWKRVHLIDASVFPTIPAMTFTLTIMANAHRIASEAVELAA